MFWTIILSMLVDDSSVCPSSNSPVLHTTQASRHHPLGHLQRMNIRRLTNLQLLRTSRGPSITSRGNLLASARSLSTSTRAYNPLFKGTPRHFDRFQSQHRSMASVSAQKATDFGDFELLQSFPIKYAPVTVSKWRSKKTGLTVVVGSHDTPIVSPCKL
jgi:hypothetical protein